MQVHDLGYTEYNGFIYTIKLDASFVHDHQKHLLSLLLEEENGLQHRSAITSALIFYTHTRYTQT